MRRPQEELSAASKHHATPPRGERFLAAFNEIEDRFRRALHFDEHAEFAEMARLYADKKRLPTVQRDELLAFASLRNAINHGRFYGGHPIAEPCRLWLKKSSICAI